MGFLHDSPDVNPGALNVRNCVELHIASSRLLETIEAYHESRKRWCLASNRVGKEPPKLLKLMSIVVRLPKSAMPSIALIFVNLLLPITSCLIVGNRLSKEMNLPSCCSITLLY